jgi:hypothetical protein
MPSSLPEFPMSGTPPLGRFAPILDRAVTACMQTELLIKQSTAAAARARELRTSIRRTRLLARETRDYWASADLLFTRMRRQVERMAAAMRATGVSRAEAVAAVRTRTRVVLYDGGFREVEVEPVVERISAWVDELFEAACGRSGRGTPSVSVERKRPPSVI